MSDDGDDHLEMDQLDDDDDAYGEVKPTMTPNTKRAKKDGSPVYQLTNVLPLPRATTYSTQALYDQIHAGDIDLEPEYQRDVVWPESKQIGLIDSILRNFYVPPIIFVSHQHEDGSEAKTCIDGKQRLTSLHRFMDGLIPHRDSVTGIKYFYKDNAAVQGPRGQTLPEKYRRLFANKQVVCIEYQDLPDSDEREIFQRVQLGMALTPAEKLQVVNTPMASFVRKIQTEYLAVGSPLDSDSFEWDRSRGGDFRCITQALYVIAKYPASTSVGAITQLEKWLQRPTTRPLPRKARKKPDDSAEDLATDDAFLARVHATFQTFSNLVRDESLRPHFLKPEWRVSPIEFVMACLLISVIQDRMPLSGLATQVGRLRERVRLEHMDIRMNSRVAKTLFDFIAEAADVGQPGPAGTGVKRKREEEEEVVLSGKERREEAVVAPPRPERVHAMEVRKTIAPPRVTPPKVPSTPGMSR